MNYFSREEAIAMFGSHLLPNSDGDVIHENLGITDGTFRFENNPEGEKAAREYCVKCKSKRVEDAMDRVKIAQDDLGKFWNRIKLRFSKDFQNIVNNAMTEIEAGVYRAREIANQEILIQRLPEHIAYDGTLLPVGSKVYMLCIDVHNTNPIEITEYEIQGFGVFSAGSNKPQDINIHMYYNRADGYKSSISPTKYSGSFDTKDVDGAGEIKCNIIGTRFFTSRELAVTAAHEFANEIIRKMKDYA